MELSDHTNRTLRRMPEEGDTIDGRKVSAVKHEGNISSYRIAAPLGVYADNPEDQPECVDCHGVQYRDGMALFFAVASPPEGTKSRKWICELCLLKRLVRRGALVNETSSRSFQFNLKEILEYVQTLEKKP